MPDKLYISSNFELNFDKDGTINTFDTFVYGKDNNGNIETYSISYNRKKSKNINIYLGQYSTLEFNDDKLLKPLIDTVKVIPLKDTVSNWNKDEYGILYYGKRSFGRNTDGIVYIDSNGNMNSPKVALNEIIGYTVSVYVPGYENIYKPVRYNLVDDLNNIKPDKLNSKDDKSGINTDEKDCDVPNSLGFKYRLKVVGDALGGKRAYALIEIQKDDVYFTINTNPFDSLMGTATGISFLNEKLGFIGISMNAGAYSELYRTEDGGKTFKRVDIPKVQVKDGSLVIEPFDFLNIPYEENGVLNIVVGQGSDGDYNAGAKALYQSKDEGVTWEYIKEVKSN